MSSLAPKKVVTFTPKCFSRGADGTTRCSLPYKLVAIDMDGTLLNAEHEVTVRTRRVLAQLLAMGVHVVFATGRPFTDVHRIKRRLEIFAREQQIPTADSAATPLRLAKPRCFAITSNGACVYDEHDRQVYERSVDPRYVRAVYDMCDDDPEVNVGVFRAVQPSDRAREGYFNLSDLDDDPAPDEWLCRHPSDEEAALYTSSHFVPRPMPDFKEAAPTSHITNLFILCFNIPKIQVVAETIKQKLADVQRAEHISDCAHLFFGADYCLSIGNDGVNKGTALAHVLEDLGLSMSDVISFGNAENDAEMLQRSGKGCIMQNALPQLKERFPEMEVVGHHNEDGVALKLMEVFGLEDIQEPEEVDVHFIVRINPE